MRINDNNDNYVFSIAYWINFVKLNMRSTCGWQKLSISTLKMKLAADGITAGMPQGLADGFEARPSAVCRAGSWRRVWWSLRSWQPSLLTIPLFLCHSHTGGTPGFKEPLIYFLEGTPPPQAPLAGE
jgi:hypothetical protein